jgi:D-arabinose 1-dehydrogenase-like Zn-dependent alcohol dehydrogenase
MTDKLAEYRYADAPLPDRNRLWPLYGAGFENLGRDGQPIEVPMPRYGSDELLVRHDACGLCFSDIKIIRMGGDHPRLYGRDLAKEPIVQGHEVSLTVVGVGENLRDRFGVGDRFVVQADIYYQGKNLAYGYMFVGGLAQYAVVGKEILEGDEGCYLIPVDEEAGYAEIALTEPWACVEAAYSVQHRTGVKEGGLVWIIGAGEGDYRLDGPFHPRKVIASHLPPDLSRTLGELAEAGGFELVEVAGQDYGAEGFDDIIILGPGDPTVIEAAQDRLARGGILNIIACPPSFLPNPSTLLRAGVGGDEGGARRKVAVDIGRIHYDGLRFVGSPGPEITASYGRNTRAELKPGGLVWFLGAGGPMGHMHVQRAIEMPDGPRKIVATNLRSGRIVELATKFGARAQDRGIELVCLTQEALGREAYQERLWEETGGCGFDDIVVLAPSVEAMEMADEYLAPGGVMNIFAGLPRGTKAELDLSLVYAQDIRFVGTSGSRIRHLQRVLEKAQAGELSPNRSVAAISGIHGAWEGLKAVREGRFPGKIVVYPQIENLGLTPLPELREKLPAVYARLEPGEMWTKAAEEELLRELLPNGT